MFNRLDVILGGPGSGKDTQAKLLQSRLGYNVLRLGELMRRYANASPAVATALEEGVLVDNDTANLVVSQQLNLYNAADKVISDGFPRDAIQAKWLDGYLQSRGQELRIVVFLRVPESELLKRLKLRNRSDDDAKIIESRFKVFSEQTIPVIEHYRKLSKLAEVDGVGTTEQVFARISQALVR